MQFVVAVSVCLRCLDYCFELVLKWLVIGGVFGVFRCCLLVYSALCFHT